MIKFEVSIDANKLGPQILKALVPGVNKAHDLGARIMDLEMLWNWDVLPAHNEPNAKIQGNAIVDTLAFSGYPFEWVTLGADTGNFDSDTTMVFMEDYSAKSEGGDGFQTGEIYFRRHIGERHIEPRDFVGRLIDEEGDRIIAEMLNI